MSTSKSKVIDEMQLAQRRLASVGVCLMDLANELQAEGKKEQAGEHYRLSVAVNALTVNFSKATGCTMILMTIETSETVVQRIRSAWGRIAELLAGDINEPELLAIEKHLDQLRDLLCSSALQKSAKGLFARQAADLARRSRN